VLFGDLMVLERCQSAEALEARRLLLLRLLVKFVCYVVQVFDWVRKVLLVAIGRCSTRTPTRGVPLGRTSPASTSVWQGSLISGHAAIRLSALLPRHHIQALIDHHIWVLENEQVSVVVADHVEFADKVLICLLQSAMQVLVQALLFIDFVEDLESNPVLFNCLIVVT